MSKLDDALRRNPTLVKPLADMLEFADAGGWGEFNVRFKFGKVYVYFKTVSVEVAETRQREEPAAIIDSKES
jgi:hypothetical protein